VKRLILLSLALALIGFNAFGEGTPKSGEFGIQTDVTLTGTNFGAFGSFGAKFWATDALALRAGVGFASRTGGNQAGTGYDLGAGAEYHFTAIGGVSPYVGAQASYSGGMPSGGGAAQSDFSVNAVLGAEYFFSSNFSWAGEFRFGYDTFNDGTTTFTFLGTDWGAMIFTWYIN
jgi:hypothetical protein